jgi:hypothetical protein
MEAYYCLIIFYKKRFVLRTFFYALTGFTEYEVLSALGNVVGENTNNGVKGM